MLQLQCLEEYYRIAHQRRGWDMFSEETAWFIYDFFRARLTGYEKLLFYGYYIVGFTMEEVGEHMHLSSQAVQKRIFKINSRIKKTWKNRKRL